MINEAAHFGGSEYWADIQPLSHAGSKVVQVVTSTNAMAIDVEVSLEAPRDSIYVHPATSLAPTLNLKQGGITFLTILPGEVGRLYRLFDDEIAGTKNRILGNSARAPIPPVVVDPDEPVICTTWQLVPCDEVTNPNSRLFSRQTGFSEYDDKVVTLLGYDSIERTVSPYVDQPDTHWSQDDLLSLVDGINAKDKCPLWLVPLDQTLSCEVIKADGQIVDDLIASEGLPADTKPVDLSGHGVILDNGICYEIAVVKPTYTEAVAEAPTDQDEVTPRLKGAIHQQSVDFGASFSEEISCGHATKYQFGCGVYYVWDITPLGGEENEWGCPPVLPEVTCAQQTFRVVLLYNSSDTQDFTFKAVGTDVEDVVVSPRRWGLSIYHDARLQDGSVVNRYTEGYQISVDSEPSMSATGQLIGEYVLEEVPTNGYTDGDFGTGSDFVLELGRGLTADVPPMQGICLIKPDQTDPAEQLVVVEDYDEDLELICGKEPTAVFLTRCDGHNSAWVEWFGPSEPPLNSWWFVGPCAASSIPDFEMGIYQATVVDTLENQPGIPKLSYADRRVDSSGCSLRSNFQDIGPNAGTFGTFTHPSNPGGGTDWPAGWYTIQYTSGMFNLDHGDLAFSNFGLIHVHGGDDLRVRWRYQDAVEGTVWNDWPDKGYFANDLPAALSAYDPTAVAFYHTGGNIQVRYVIAAEPFHQLRGSPGFTLKWLGV